MYKSYFDEFQLISYKDLFLNNPHRVKEIGYIILNKIFNNLGFRSLLVFISLITIGIKSFVFYKYTKLPILSNFIYFSFFLILRDFTQLRDSLAVTFLIISFILYYLKKYKFSVLLFILAASFHFVALIYIPVIFILHFFPREKAYYGIIVGGLLLYFINPLQYIIKLEFLPTQILKYNYFLGGGSFSVMFLGFIGAFLFQYLLNSEDNTKRSITVLSFKITCVALFFGFMTFNHPVFFRVTNALMFFSIIMVSNITVEKKFKHESVAFCLMLVFFVYIFFRSLAGGILHFGF